MSQDTKSSIRVISSAIWIEPDYLCVRLEMGTVGRMRFTVKSHVFAGTPLEGWSAEQLAADQWRASSEVDDASGVEEIFWRSGATGARLKESRLIDLLLIAREDMTDAERIEASSWMGRFIILEQGFHNYGVFDLLDDLALRVPVSRRQFNSRLALDADSNLVLSATSLDEQNHLLCRSSALGIEYELHVDPSKNLEAPVASGVWGIDNISREANDSGFHEAIDQFITLSPPPLAAI